MQPKHTPADPTKAIQIADYFRNEVAQGVLKAGDYLPPLDKIGEDWDVNVGVVREAQTIMKAEGLISTSRGRPAQIRKAPDRIVRDSRRHQEEKDRVHLDHEERRVRGAAEVDHGQQLDALTFVAHYSRMDDLGKRNDLFKMDDKGQLLRREYELRDDRKRLAWSVSYIPVSLIEGNPDLLDQDQEPWPGGTMHQLSTVGIEVAEVIDEVHARMPTTIETREWSMEPGVPLLVVRRISIDTRGRVVEVSDADYPADRIELRFHTPLTAWKAE
ncbi:GntR family transcriptional regulator [Stackebrandtia soli]|uniref:GntR family transcriptional regulator n=1 Tax=Stackebrandtia soli TaxID=1892856 RepID=UPI0039E7515C